MTAVLVERKWTRDHVRVDVDSDGTTEIDRYRFPTPPPGDGWVICNQSSDNWTRWRRIRLSATTGFFE